MAKLLTVKQVVNLLRKECVNSGSASTWCKKNKVSETYVGEILQNKKIPGPKICRALKVNRIFVFEPQE